MTTKIIFSGFGGQGVLTLGQIVSQIAMNKNLEVTWMPSYGAEMRGGTANCAVIISDKIIGSPIVLSDIDILVAMNSQSISKFINLVKKDGIVIINSSIVKEDIKRDDINIININATEIATDVGSVKAANMVMLAGFLNKTNLFDIFDIKKALDDKFKAKNPKIIELNIAAINKGLEAIKI